MPRIQLRPWHLRHVSLATGFASALMVLAYGNDTDGIPTATSANTSTPASTTHKSTLAATLAVQANPNTPSPGATSSPIPVDDVPIKTGDGISMGGAALGGNAETTLLGQTTLSEVPDGSLAWIAYEATLEDGQRIKHDHEFTFVYAAKGTYRLELRDNDRSLASGEKGVVSAGAIHGHVASQGQSVFWEVRLVDSGSYQPAGFPNSTLVFESDVLQDIPASLMATFLLVRVPAGCETSGHTHPGPELIYQITGKSDYQNALIGTKTMGPGAVEGIPLVTSVQKRNPYRRNAEFLSWFLVDASQPFASPASFKTSTSLEAQSENLASLARGARVVGVSSNYASGANDSSFGANKALDIDPATAWSSDGDGDDAWLEIEFPSETAVTSLGLWSRSMGTSAEIVSFRVVSDKGDVAGLFMLDGASQIFYFDVEITGKRLRFEALETSGGNSGVVEIEVYEYPLP